MINCLGYVNLGVEDVGSASEFHEQVFGMNIVGRDRQTTFLACAADGEVNLVLSAGGGLRCTAFDVASEEDLDFYARRLSTAGIPVETRSNAAPGQSAAIRFATPSRHVVELSFCAEHQSYVHPTRLSAAPAPGASPLGVDHINLRAKDAKVLSEFFCEHLDFMTSDVFEPSQGMPLATWLRVGSKHHDLAISGIPGATGTLDHVAWTLGSFDDVKRAADALGNHGTVLEAFPGRHGIGASVSAYFQAPGGHRYELCAEMASVRSGTPPVVWDDFAAAYSSWGIAPPDSLMQGS